MKAPGLIASTCLFLLSCGGTWALLRSSPAAAPLPPPAPLAGSLAAKSKHREASAFASIQALLRAGKVDAAREELARLAKRDPVAFFELLERLPGMPGLEDTIASAAAALPWKDDSVRDLLNRIGPHKWRDLAWGSYTGARVDQVPDEEIFEVAAHAREQTSFTSIRRLLEVAAKDRPREFFDFLNRRGGTSIREEFMEELAKHHPDLAHELFTSIPDGSPGCNYDRAYVLQARARLVPTAENLRQVFEDTGSRGVYSSDFASLFAMQAYRDATPEERGKMLDYITGQPALSRNRMLSGPLFVGENKDLMPAAQFAPMLGVFSSGFLQAEALETWLARQPDFDPAQRAWIDKLPTEKLKLKANQLLDQRAAAKAKQ